MSVLATRVSFRKPVKCGALTRMLVVLTALLAPACVTTERLTPRVTPEDERLAWFGPASTADVRSLHRWRGSVGPALIAVQPPAALRPATTLTIVSWNTHVGAADVGRFVSDLRAAIGPDAPIVLLLQEVVRRGQDVPAQLERGAAFAARLGARNRGDAPADDIAAIAAATGLHLFYAPSMRNGGPRASDEDRGNAILATLPLSELAAIELPFERQRRVAIAASVTGLSANGSRWTLRVVSAHLDNVASWRRLWIVGSQVARVRQARGLVTHLAGDAPLVLGGDFNTWFGFADRAYQETARAFGNVAPADRGATFRGWLRLDHMFYRLAAGWSARIERARSRYGSDHVPLIATIEMG